MGVPASMALDATNVYVAGVEQDPSELFHLGLRKVARDGSTTEVLAYSVDYIHTPRLAVDDTSLYWTLPVDGAVAKVSKQGGVVETLFSGWGEPSTLAVDDTSIYWTDVSAGTVMKAPKDRSTPDGGAGDGGAEDAGTAVTLASEQPAPSTLAIDATSVYWTTLTRVMKVQKGGGPLVVLATGQGDPTTAGLTAAEAATLGGAAAGAPNSIAVDATSVYWTNPASATVMKVAKDGGAPVPLATARPGCSVVSDPRNLYWGVRCGSTLFQTRGSLDGGVVTPACQWVTHGSFGAFAMDWPNVYYSWFEPVGSEHVSSVTLE